MATYKVPETLEELQARDAADGAEAAASATAAQEFEAPEGTAVPRSSFFQGAATTEAEPEPPRPSVGSSARPLMPLGWLPDYQSTVPGKGAPKVCTMWNRNFWCRRMGPRPSCERGDACPFTHACNLRKSMQTCACNDAEHTAQWHLETYGPPEQPHFRADGTRRDDKDQPHRWNDGSWRGSSSSSSSNWRGSWNSWGGWRW